MEVVSAGRWFVQDRPDLGRYETEGAAQAAAWSVTPAGEARPEVRQRAGVPTAVAEPELPPAEDRRRLYVEFTADQRFVTDTARVQSQLLDRLRDRVKKVGSTVDWGSLLLTEDVDSRTMMVTYRAQVEVVVT